MASLKGLHGSGPVSLSPSLPPYISLTHSHLPFEEVAPHLVTFVHEDDTQFFGRDALTLVPVKFHLLDPRIESRLQREINERTASGSASKKRENSLHTADYGGIVWPNLRHFLLRQRRPLCPYTIVNRRGRCLIPYGPFTKCLRTSLCGYLFQNLMKEAVRVVRHRLQGEFEVLLQRCHHRFLHSNTQVEQTPSTHQSPAPCTMRPAPSTLPFSWLLLVLPQC